MPTRYRDALLEQCGGQLVLTIDIKDKCLLLYPLPEWLEIEKAVKELPALNKATRRVQRLLLGHATDMDMDSAGRISIPSVLREHAELDKKVMLVGQGNKFEIWSEENWKAELDAMMQEEDEDDSLPDQLKLLKL